MRNVLMKIDIKYFDYFWLIFWSMFDWLDQHFLIILTDMWAAMNDIDWDWIRIMMNKVNWYSAVHCKNDLIDLDWEAYNDLIKQKLLYAQYYAHEAWFWTFQTKWSRNANVFFERRIVVTECSISSSRFSLELKANTKSSTNW